MQRKKAIPINKRFALGLSFLVFIMVSGSCMREAPEKVSGKLLLPRYTELFDPDKPLTSSEIKDWFSRITCEPPSRLALSRKDADILLYTSGEVAALMSMFPQDEPALNRDWIYWKLMAANWISIVELYENQHGKKGGVSLVNLAVIIGRSMELVGAQKRLNEGYGKSK